MRKEKYPYDSVVIFQTPINLPRTNGEWTDVHGILFSRQELIERTKSSHERNIKCTEVVDTYVGYLHGCHNFLKNGHKIGDGVWKTKRGHQFDDTKGLRYLVSYVQDLDYEVLYDDEPVEIRENETEEDWILDKRLIERLRQDFS